MPATATTSLTNCAPRGNPTPWAESSSGREVYNYHRYYDPATGRYITSDPIGLAGGLNTYSYAGQNPIVNIDPLGLTPGTAAGCVAGAPAGPLGCGIGATIGTAITGGAVLAEMLAVPGDTPITIDPDRPIPPQLPGYIDPASLIPTTVSQCDADYEPPEDPQERCFNGVRLQFIACQARGTNPLICQSQRLFGLLACAAFEPGED